MARDFFIIFAGIIFIILIFLLFRSLTSLELKAPFPRSARPVIDVWGNPIESPGEAVDARVVKKFLSISMICASIGLVAFLFLFFFLKWFKPSKKHYHVQGD